MQLSQKLGSCLSIHNLCTTR